MKFWLSSAWEPNWRSFQYFNLYRLIVAALVLAGMLFSPAWKDFYHLAWPTLLPWVGGAYLAALVAGLILSVRWQRHFDLQLSLQVGADILAVNLVMYAAGGIASGLGILLLVSLAAASLVGRGRLVLFYAAVATLAVLGMQIQGAVSRGFEMGSIVQAGFLSAAFFATAVLARLLGQRLMANEELARRRGIELENQSRISQRVIEQLQTRLSDLEQRGLLDETLVLFGSEFGRLPTAQGPDGRDHNITGYAMWMAGAGVKPGFTYGQTDEIGLHAIEGRMHTSDLHATLLQLLGFDHEQLTYRIQGRDYRLTDVHGHVVSEILT